MKILTFNWQTFDAVWGMKYVAGVVVMFALLSIFEFPWFAAGLSALLAWLCTLPGRPLDRLLGPLTYVVLGTVLAAVTYLIQGTYWPWIVGMFLVAFGGTFAMILGMRAFMVGWCLIVWFYVSPMIGSTGDINQFLLAHLVGGGTVLGLIALPIVIAQIKGKLDEYETGEEMVLPPLNRRFVVEYSTAVAIALTGGLILGDAWLKTDPTLIVNATLMIIFPSLAMTWVLAADRIIGAALGITLGFLLGLYVQSEWFEIALWIVMSFFALSMLLVNAGAVTFCFMTMFAASWGAQGYEAGSAIVNERIFAELTGIGIALGIIFLREFLGTPAESGDPPAQGGDPPG